LQVKSRKLFVFSYLWPSSFDLQVLIMTEMIGLSRLNREFMTSHRVQMSNVVAFNSSSSFHLLSTNSE